MKMKLAALVVAKALLARASKPTSSPTKAPWEIKFVSMASNFTADTVKGLVDLTYDIPVGRPTPHQYSYKGYCDAEITDISPVTHTTSRPITPGVLATTTQEGGTTGDSRFERYEINHEVNKTLLGTSTLWNNSTNELQMCQVVELYTTSGDTNYTIYQDLRNITVGFNFTAEFETEVDLTGADILQANATTNLQDYISAYICMGLYDYDAVTATYLLAPNELLNVCVNSSSTDVQIDSMDLITLKGTDQNGDDSALEIVKNDAVEIPAITQHMYNGDYTTYSVSTRVPIGFFDFEKENAEIKVVGSLTLNLIGDETPGRRLSVPIHTGERKLQGGDAGANAAGFDVNVKLVAGDDQEEDEVAAFSSGSARGGVVAGLAAFFALLTVW